MADDDEVGVLTLLLLLLLLDESSLSTALFTGVAEGDALEDELEPDDFGLQYPARRTFLSPPDFLTWCRRVLGRPLPPWADEAPASRFAVRRCR